MGSCWRIGRVLGVPIEFDASAVIVAGVMAFTLATSAFPAQFPEFSTLTYAILGISASLLLYVSVWLHELGHAVVAQRDGLAVEGILLFAFGGIAKLAEEPRSARQELRMAVAGPVCSLALGATLVGLVLLLGHEWGHSPLLALMVYLAAINLALGFFNLVPGFPLDGGRILRALLWGSTHDLRRATWAATALGQAVALLLVFWGLFRLYEGVQAWNFTGPVISAVFLILTGIFLSGAGRRSYQAVAEKVPVAVDEDKRRQVRR